MKKAIAIIVLGLLWCNVAHSSCKDDLTYSVIELKKADTQGYFIFKFANPTKHKIKIISYELQTKEGETMLKRFGKKYEMVIFPFTRKDSFWIGRTGLMTEHVVKYIIECEYLE